MLTVKEAAERATVSTSLIYAWVKDGTLTPIRVGRKGKRGHIRISAEELNAVMEACKRTGQAERAARPLKHIRLD